MKLLPLLFALTLPAFAGTPDKDAAPAASGEAEAPEWDAHAQISVHLDWIRLPHAAANQLVRQRLPHERDANALYAAVQELIVQKKAERLDFTAIPVHSGQRSKTESIDETPYPSEFDPSMSGIRINGAGEKAIGPLGHATPSSFVFRNAGATTEVKATLMDDGHTIDLTLAPESVDYLKDLAWGSGVNELKQPVFGTMKLTTSVFTESGAWQLVSLLTPPPAPENIQKEVTPALSPDRVLLFVRATSSRGPRIKPAEQTPAKQLLVFAEWIEMDTATAASLLAKYPDFSNSPALRGEMDPLLADGRASLMHTAALIVRNNCRAKMESIVEWIHPGELDRSKAPPRSLSQMPVNASPFKSKVELGSIDPFSSTLPTVSPVSWMPESFDHRNLGTTLEAGVSMMDGIIDMNLAPGLVFNAGVEGFGEGLARAERSGFYKLEPASQMLLAPNTPGMVCSFDVPWSGGKDNGEGKELPAARTRKVFLFVRGIL
jgi:hypothetical protein